MIYVRIFIAALATICFMLSSISEKSGFDYDTDVAFNDKASKICRRIGLVLAAATILWLIISDRNEWIFSKTVFYALIWFYAGADYRQSFFAKCVVTVMSVGLLIASFSYAMNYDHPTIAMNKLLKSTELARMSEVHIAGDSEEAFLPSNILVWLDGDVYRYGYYAEDGNIERSYLPIEKTTIIYDEDETPRLDEYCLEKHWYARQNNQLVEHTSLHETWYELHLPTDAVIVSFRPSSDLISSNTRP